MLAAEPKRSRSEPTATPADVGLALVMTEMTYGSCAIAIEMCWIGATHQAADVVNGIHRVADA